AKIELVSGDDLLGGYRSAHDLAAFEDGDAIPCLRQIRGGDEAVVAGPDDDHIVIAAHAVPRHVGCSIRFTAASSTSSAALAVRPRSPAGGWRKRSNPCTTSRLVTRKKTASSSGSGPRAGPSV